jgi:hypothetical protein
MAKTNSDIPPFPATIDRFRFGDWLSGFIDGEGCFSLTIQHDLRDGGARGVARLLIGLRSDDRSALERIMSFWGCGRLTWNKPNSSVKNARPTHQYRVSKIHDLQTIVVPHFERHPLWAKKSNDFKIWKRGVALIHEIYSKPQGRPRRGMSHPWNADYTAEFDKLINALRQGRQFNAPAPVLPPVRVPRSPPNSQGRLFET